MPLLAYMLFHDNHILYLQQYTAKNKAMLSPLPAYLKDKSMEFYYPMIKASKFKVSSQGQTLNRLANKLAKLDCFSKDSEIEPAMPPPIKDMPLLSEICKYKQSDSPHTIHSLQQFNSLSALLRKQPLPVPSIEEWLAQWR